MFSSPCIIVSQRLMSLSCVPLPSFRYWSELLLAGEEIKAADTAGREGETFGVMSSRHVFGDNRLSPNFS
jgi:hypothetical protein